MRTERANGHQVTSRLRKERGGKGGYASGNGPPGPGQGEGSLREDARVSGDGCTGQEVQGQPATHGEELSFHRHWRDTEEL